MDSLSLLLSLLIVTPINNENQPQKWWQKTDVLMSSDGLQLPETQELRTRGLWNKIKERLRRMRRGRYKPIVIPVPTEPNPNWRPTSVLLGTVMVEVKGSDGQYHPVRAFIDSGASYPMIEPQVVTRTKLRRMNSGVVDPTSASGANLANHGATMVEFRSITDRSIKFTSRSLIMPLNMKFPYKPVAPKIKEQWEHLKPKADPDFFKTKDVEFLIAADVAPLIWTRGTKGARNPQEGITAMNSVFGWVFMGIMKT